MWATGQTVRTMRSDRVVMAAVNSLDAMVGDTEGETLSAKKTGGIEDEKRRSVQVCVGREGGLEGGAGQAVDKLAGR